MMWGVCPAPDRPHLRVSDGYRVACEAHGDAVAFVSQHHYAKGAARSSVRRDALWSPNGIAVGVAMWMPPLPSAAKTAVGLPQVAHLEIAWRGVLALSRLVMDPEVGVLGNATGFLLAGSMRLIDRERWPLLLTFADSAHGHVGTVYRATGWIDTGLVPGGTIWRHRETGAQRGGRCGPVNLTVAQLRGMGVDVAADLEGFGEASGEGSGEGEGEEGEDACKGQIAAVGLASKGLRRCVRRRLFGFASYGSIRSGSVGCSAPSRPSTLRVSRRGAWPQARAGRCACGTLGKILHKT